MLSISAAKIQRKMSDCDSQTYAKRVNNLTTAVDAVGIAAATAVVATVAKKSTTEGTRLNKAVAYTAGKLSQAGAFIAKKSAPMTEAVIKSKPFRSLAIASFFVAEKSKAVLNAVKQPIVNLPKSAKGFAAAAAVVAVASHIYRSGEIKGASIAKKD